MALTQANCSLPHFSSAYPTLQVQHEQGSPASQDISFDDVVGHVLRPALAHVRRSPHLEAAMAFAALVSETLGVVCEQVRKWYVARVEGLGRCGHGLGCPGIGDPRCCRRVSRWSLCKISGCTKAETSEFRIAII